MKKPFVVVLCDTPTSQSFSSSVASDPHKLLLFFFPLSSMLVSYLRKFFLLCEHFWRLLCSFTLTKIKIILSYVLPPINWLFRFQKGFLHYFTHTFYNYILKYFLCRCNYLRTAYELKAQNICKGISFLLQIHDIIILDKRRFYDFWKIASTSNSFQKSLSFWTKYTRSAVIFFYLRTRRKFYSLWIYDKT